MQCSTGPLSLHGYFQSPATRKFNPDKELFQADTEHSLTINTILSCRDQRKVYIKRNTKRADTYCLTLWSFECAKKERRFQNDPKM